MWYCPPFKLIRFVVDDATIAQKFKSDEDKRPSSTSPSSSVSSSENSALLMTVKGFLKKEEDAGIQTTDRTSGLLKRRPAVRRHTTAESR